MAVDVDAAVPAGGALGALPSGDGFGGVLLAELRLPGYDGDVARAAGQASQVRQGGDQQLACRDLVWPWGPAGR